MKLTRTAAAVIVASLLPVLTPTVVQADTPHRSPSSVKSSPAAVTVKLHMCNAGKPRRCGELVQPPAGSPMRREARDLATWRNLPMDELTRTTYLGHWSRDLTDGRKLYAVPSKLHPGRFHLYSIVLAR